MDHIIEIEEYSKTLIKEARSKGLKVMGDPIIGFKLVGENSKHYNDILEDAEDYIDVVELLKDGEIMPFDENVWNESTKTEEG